MSKHTPGPWVINRNQTDCGEDKISIEAADEYFIAQVDPGVSQEANASLIAAAPELLEACQLMLTAMKLANWEGDFAALKGIAAIAKATGETHEEEV
jgi:hypothetical protein